MSHALSLQRSAKADDMHEPGPITNTMKISEVKNHLSSLVNEVYRKKTRVLVEKAGIPVAALVSTEDLRQLARLDAQRAERRRVVAAMREAFRGVPPEEIERETEKAVAEVKAEMRAEREAAAARA
jgi:prevent-host-death family protein